MSKNLVIWLAELSRNARFRLLLAVARVISALRAAFVFRALVDTVIDGGRR